MKFIVEIAEKDVPENILTDKEEMPILLYDREAGAYIPGLSRREVDTATFINLDELLRWMSAMDTPITIELPQSRNYDLPCIILGTYY